ncbi:MAG: carboxypeptidase regulatory-like domain-containing protein [Flavobacteriales bacterium]|nr:carboxypeptidase regulatory-like domain-containing protein [Flavobacteriales bacterium]
MKYVFLFFLLVIFSFNSNGQILERSRENSYNVNVYKLESKNAKKFFDLKYGYHFPSRFLKSKVDSFPSDSASYYKSLLPAGNYILVQADFHRNNAGVSAEYFSASQIEVKIFNNNRDLSIYVFKRGTNKVINDAELVVNRTKVPFNSLTNRYTLEKTNKHGLLQVKVDGNISFYKIDRNVNNSKLLRAYRKVIQLAPIRIATFPIRYSWGHLSNAYYYVRFGSYSYGSKTIGNGYLAFSKPMYLPGDTLKWKAFLVNKNGKAITSPIRVYIHDSRNSSFDGKRKGVFINPESPGAYVYETILGDTLRINKSYNVDLFKGKSKKLLISEQFILEDYQLDESSYEASVEETVYSKGQPIVVELSGTDANGLNILDSRVELKLIADFTIEFLQDTVFIPKTLWEKKIELDPLGDTRVSVPDSIWPTANIAVSVEAVFNNSNNETHEESFKFDYIGIPGRINSKLEKDSIIAMFYVNSENIPVKGRLVELYYSDTLSDRMIAFPFKEKLKTHITSYVFIKGDVREEVLLNEQGSLFECDRYRDNSRMKIEFINPRNIPISYTIYKNGNTIEEQGVTVAYENNMVTDIEDNYAIACSYIWGGEPVNLNYNLSVYRNGLQVDIQQPDRVFPGQEVDITVLVKDEEGIPVENVNVLAGAFNSQFDNDEIKRVPALGKIWRRPFINSHGISNVSRNNRTRNLDDWSTEFRLDTIPLFQLMYPEDGMALIYDSSRILPNAQFAPHLYRNGNKHYIDMILVDDKLVYYNRLNYGRNYSLIIEEGKHKITLRADAKLYEIEGVVLKKGAKLDLSLDLRNIPKRVKITRTTAALTTVEKDKVYRSTLYFRADIYNKKMCLWQEGSPVKTVLRSGRRYAVGPIKPGFVYLDVEGMPTKKIFFKPGEELIVYADSISPEIETNFKDQRFYYTPSNTQKIGDVVDTSKVILERKVIPRFDFLYRGENDAHSDSSGTFQFEYTGDSSFNLMRICKIEDPSTARFYRGYSRMFTKLSPGWYQMMLIKEEGNYYILDSVEVKARGINFLRFGNENIKLAKSALDLNSMTYTTNKMAGKYSYQLLRSTGEPELSGTLTNVNGEPIPFANITVQKNGKVVAGSPTNFDGVFKIKGLIPGTYDIVAKYIGYLPLIVPNIELTQGVHVIDLRMANESISLDEMQVVAFEVNLIDHKGGSSYKQLEELDLHRMPGRGMESQALLAGGVVASEGEIESIRGARGDATVYYIDGIKVLRLADLPQSSIDLAMQNDKDFEKIVLPMQGGVSVNSKYKNRNNFNDVGYWQPNLYTNSKGEASFKVKFPDNITSWKSYALAMDEKKNSGMQVTQVKSYLPMQAQLATPRFMLQGDKALVIGKISNYNDNVEKVNSTFLLNGDVLSNIDTTVEHSIIEYFEIATFQTDTMEVSYSIKGGESFRDGEERHIPILPIGVKETEGAFYSLRKDSVINLSFDKSRGNVTLYAVNNTLSPILDELKKLEEYPFYCMEQTASKLIGYLLKKEIYKKLNKRFNDNNEIRRLIKKLEAAQNKNGGWGWWSLSLSNPWMSSYVLKALCRAEQAGFKVINIELAIKRLTWDLKVLKGNEFLYTLQTLSELNANIPYANYLKKIEGNELTSYNKLMILKIRQDNNLTYSLNNVLSRVKKTYMGNYYWGGEKCNWYSNSTDVTLLSYQLIEGMDSLHPFLPLIRNYFLEVKGGYEWQNTIKKAQIIKTILPGLIRDYGANSKHATLEIIGQDKSIIEDFPYSNTISDFGEMKIKKTGEGPIYLTTHQQSWNTTPNEVDSMFRIETWFESDGKKLDTLIAGQLTDLKIRVIAKRKGEYINIEVPIPGGCSYGNNEKNKSFNETHREYFKHKTNIYLERMEAREYVFTIALQPRFSGTYSMNPAKAELMYFPMFYGRNKIESTVVD